MTAATFILIHKQPDDPAAAAEALKFFAWAYAKGDKMAEELDYVPMPKKVVEEIEKMWASQDKGRGWQAPLHATDGSLVLMQRAAVEQLPRVLLMHNRLAARYACAAAGGLFE